MYDLEGLKDLCDLPSLRFFCRSGAVVHRSGGNKRRDACESGNRNRPSSQPFISGSMSWAGCGREN